MNYTRMQVPGLSGIFFRDLELTLGGRKLSVLSASGEDVLSWGRRQEGRAMEETPYWATAWPAGLALARLLAAEDLRGMRVLEVGCGVGISSLGAVLGGAEVLTTDNQPLALRVTMMNARRNRLALRGIAADWRAWPVRGRFERVIGSDVTYEPAAFDALLAVLDEALLPGGEAWLTDPGRLMISAFQRRAIEAGWSWEMETLPREGTQAVFLYRLRR